MTDYRSDNESTCGICGGKAHRKYPDTELFSTCEDCGAEVSGTGAHNEPDRYYWTGAAQTESQRATMAAMLDDADRNYFGPDHDWN